MSLFSVFDKYLQLKIKYDYLYQVTIESQIAWLVDAYGDQVPGSDLKSLAKNIIEQRIEELRRKDNVL